MKRSVSLLCAVTFAAGTAVACTPKPVTADPTVDSIIEAMESGEPLGEYFDKSVNNKDFAIAHDVVLIAGEQLLGFERIV